MSTMIDGGATRPEPEPNDEIGGDPCGDLLPGDESLPLAAESECAGMGCSPTSACSPECEERYAEARTEYPFVVRKTLLEMQEEVFDVNVANGWFEDDRRFAEDVALLHSEASEMLEAYRHHGLEDATAEHPPCDCPVATSGFRGMHHSTECAIFTLPKPEGVGSEAADVLIRLLDTCKRTGIDLDVEYARKIAFNETRAYRHGGKRL